MHEYTTKNPNFPLGTGPQTMLSSCVLCKIYKKETKEKKGTQNVNHAKQAVVRVRNDQQEEESTGDEQNQLHTDESSPKRTRLSDNQQQGGSTSTSHYDQSSYESILLTDGYYQQNQPMSLAATNNSSSSSSVRVSDGAETTLDMCCDDSWDSADDIFLLPNASPQANDFKNYEFLLQQLSRPLY